MSGGWFRTGDIGRIDDDGYLTITNRKKDVIIRGGENIASKEVEDLLARHPAELESAAVGVDPVTGTASKSRCSSCCVLELILQTFEVELRGDGPWFVITFDN